MGRDSERYEVRRLKYLLEKYFGKNKKDSESALIELSQIDYVSGEDLANAVEYIETDKQIYDEAFKDLEIVNDNLEGSLKEIKDKIRKKGLQKIIENRKLFEGE